jgi:hypothetical protein
MCRPWQVAVTGAEGGDAVQVTVANTTNATLIVDQVLSGLASLTGTPAGDITR